MGNWSDLKQAVAQVIRENGNQEITGQILQNVLNSIISNVGQYATFVGIATPLTNPGTPDGNVYYIASQAGTYANFGGISLDGQDILILLYNGATWTAKRTGAATKADIEKLNANTGIDEYETFSDQKGYKAGTTVKKNGLLKTFNTDHAAGAWDDKEVVDTNVIQFIQIATSLLHNNLKVNILPKSELTRGYYINNSDGVLAIDPVPTGACTDYIEVQPNKVYLYVGSLLDARTISIYDSDKRFIMSTQHGEMGVIIRYATFETPSNAAYIRCSVYCPNNGYVVYKIGKPLVSTSDISAITNNLSTLQATLDKKVFCNLGTPVDLSEAGRKQGYYIQKDGAEKRHENSAIIDITNLTPLSLYVFTDANMYDLRAIVFYDSSDNIIEAYCGTDLNVTYPKNSKANFALVIPKNTVKVRLSIGNKNVNPLIYRVMDVNHQQLSAYINTILTDFINTYKEVVGYTTYEKPKLLPQSELTDGYYIGDNGNVISGFPDDKVTDYIAVNSNAYYKYIGKISDTRCYAEYDSDKKLIKAIRAARIVKDFTFKTTKNTKYVRFSVYAVPNYSLYSISPSIMTMISEINNIIKKIQDSIVILEDKDYECTFPNYIFNMDNDSRVFYGREYIPYVYPESLIREPADIKVNDHIFCPVKNRTKNSETVEENQFSLTLSGSGFKTKTAQTKIISTKISVAKNKPIRYLAIGDSITANQIPNMDGNYVGGWCYPSLAKEIWLKDNIDFKKQLMSMLLIGTTNFKETKFAYNNEEIDLRGFSEGRGSWTTANYLRHATSICSKGNVSEDSSGQTHAETSWLLLGLETKQPIDSVYNSEAEKETWTGSSEQDNLIRTTPTGKYHWDYGENLWNWCKKRSSSLQGDYIGSEEQKQQIDTVINALLDNPVNPFFDKDIAKDNDYAFSLTTYLNRYKTLQDDGSTRLIANSTAGTKITAENINSIDVCTPTHITIELGENERWWYNVTAEQTCDDIEKIAEIINREYPGIKIGFINPRYLGVFYPEKWYNFAVCGEMSYQNNMFKYDMNKIMQNRWGTTVEKNKNCFLPCYFVQSPLYRSQSRYDISLLDNTNMIIGGTDPNHPGLLSYMAIAHQVLSWIYYTLSE